MIEIEARSGFALGNLVNVWSYVDSMRAELPVGVWNLLQQLNPDTKLMNSQQFWSVARQDRCVTALALDYSDPLKTKIVGIAMMFVHQKFSSTNGFVEDVVVDNAYRGQKIGEKLMEKLLEVAKALNLKNVSLSSGNKSERAAAHKLYLKLGFEKRDSTLFRKKL